MNDSEVFKKRVANWKLVLKKGSDPSALLKERWNSTPDFLKGEFLIDFWLVKGPSAKFPYEWWLPYFKDVGFVSNLGNERPTEDIELYRGSTSSFKNGMSWTPSLVYANVMKPSEGKIYKLMVRPESVLAVLGFSIFTEYVLDPSQINEADIEEYVE